MEIVRLFLLGSLIISVSLPVFSQDRSFPPVTDLDLLNPSPADWLMYSRTYDNQRYSPLNIINRENVDGLQLAWSAAMYPGTQENIPLVARGIMYVAHPGAIIQAREAATGELLWEYQRDLPDDLGDYIRAVGRARTLAIYQDMVYYASPDGYLLAIDAATGAVRWQTYVHDYRTGTQHTTGPTVIRGNVLTGRNCGDTREYCFIAAHDAVTGEEIWKFQVTAATGEPGGDTWGEMPDDRRLASPWGLPGDMIRNVTWSIGVRPTHLPTPVSSAMTVIPLPFHCQPQQSFTVTLRWH